MNKKVNLFLIAGMLLVSILSACGPKPTQAVVLPFPSATPAPTATATDKPWFWETWGQESNDSQNPESILRAETPTLEALALNPLLQAATPVPPGQSVATHSLPCVDGGVVGQNYVLTSGSNTGTIPYFRNDPGKNWITSIPEPVTVTYLGMVDRETAWLTGTTIETYPMVSIDSIGEVILANAIAQIICTPVQQQ